MTEPTPTVQVHRVYVRASPQAIWDALTTPEWTTRYGYQGPVDYDLRPGGEFRAMATDPMRARGAPEVVVDGEVIEAYPPHRLVQTWRARYLGEGFTRLTYEIEELDSGVSRLTVTHDLAGAPQTAAQTAGQMEGAGGGWSEVLSDLKSLLETGRPLYD